MRVFIILIAKTNLIDYCQTLISSGGLSFVDILILTSRIEILDTNCRARRKLIQYFSKEYENTPKGGQKDHFKLFSNPWLA